MTKYFTIIEKIIIGRGLNMEAMGLENEIFLMKINVNACTLVNFLHIFSSVSGKLPPGKFPPIKLSPGELPPGKFSPRIFPPGIFPPMFLSIFIRVF